MVKRFLCAAVMSLSLIGAAQAQTPAISGAAGAAQANASGWLNAFQNHSTGTNTSSGTSSLSGQSTAGFQQSFASPKSGNMSINFNTTGLAHNDTNMTGSNVTSNSNFSTSGFSKGNAQFSSGQLSAFAGGTGSETSKFSNVNNYDNTSAGVSGAFNGEFSGHGSVTPWKTTTTTSGTGTTSSSTPATSGFNTFGNTAIPTNASVVGQVSGSNGTFYVIATPNTTGNNATNNFFNNFGNGTGSGTTVFDKQ